MFSDPSEDQKRKQKEIEAKEQNKSKLNIYKRTVYMQTEITISMLDKMLRLRSTSVDAESEQNKDLSSISSEESVDITKK